MRVIAVNTSRIGDLVSGMGVVNFLRDRFGAVDVLPEPRYAALLDGEPGLRVMNPEGAAATAYDLLLDLSTSKKSGRFVRRIRAKRKIALAGTVFKRFLARFTYSSVLRREDPHIVNGFLPFIRLFGETVMPVPRLTDNRNGRALEILAELRGGGKRMLAGFHYEAASGLRVIPEDLALGIIERLGGLGAVALLIGTDEGIARRLEERSGGKARHFGLTLSEMKTALAGLDLFIGPDSGPLHVAAALGVPSIGLYGPNISARSGPVAPNVRIVEHPLDCRPCNQNRDCPHGVRCLAEITPEMVMEKVKCLSEP